jgi:glycosyltransferase involved in cell wall biosynthesis
MLVSVWITTYNHEAFIAEALEGVLNQVTDFDFEIIIGEDCSQDRTREIVLAYKEKYPEKITLFLPSANLGMNPMCYATYPLCKGKYIAWLDGDDYWIDQYKLQKQVDFLENNPDIVMCFHKVKLVNEVSHTSSESGHPNRRPDVDVLTQDDFLDSINPVYTPSVVHRNILGKELPDWFYHLPFPDLGFYFLLLQHGNVKYLSEAMCVYRIHKMGAFQGNSSYNNLNKFVVFFQTLFLNMEIRSRAKVSAAICRFSLCVLYINLRNGNFQETKKNLASLRKHRFERIITQEWLLLKTITLLCLKFPLMAFLAYRQKNLPVVFALPYWFLVHSSY